MSTPSPLATLKMITIADIEVLNTRERNQRTFEEITENIKQIGLKKPITVTSRPIGNGQMKYLLVCGEGRMKAFKALGETEIPAMVIDVSDEDAFIMSLAENIARRQCRSIELLAGVQRLRDLGYDKKTIADKTGLSLDYIHGIVLLLNHGEDRLLMSVESGKIPLSVALQITGAGTDSSAIQIALQDAYEAGHLRGKQLLVARRIVERRNTYGKSIRSSRRSKSTTDITSSSLMRNYQREYERQKLIVKKSDYAQHRLMFVVGALRSLLSNENFTNLLRAEGLDTLPSFLAERVWPSGQVK
jgi:ParB family chromosome partitioning protein